MLHRRLPCAMLQNRLGVLARGPEPVASNRSRTAGMTAIHVHEKGPDPKARPLRRKERGEVVYGIAGVSNPSAKMRSPIVAVHVTATSVTLAAATVPLPLTMLQVWSVGWAVTVTR